MSGPPALSRPPDGAHDRAMFDRIIVGFDGSPTSRRAVDWAAREAAARRASLDIVTGIDQPWVGADADLTTSATRAATGTTDDDLAVERARIAADHPDLTVRCVTERGSAVHVLRHLGRTADLIVIGAVGRTPESPRHLGATARALARRTSVPLLVVPTAAPLGPIWRVIGGLDGSPRDVEVIEAATYEANLFGAEIVMVHSRQSDEPEEHAARIVDIAARVARGHTQQAVSAHLATAPPSAAILERADGRTIAVVGQHHTLALSCALLGSSAVDLVRAAAIPVLIIPTVTHSAP